MAEKDFGDFGFSDVARRSVDALEHFFELVKHTGKSVGWASDSMSWEKNATIVGVKNEHGEVLYLPAEYMRWYLDLPRSTILRLIEPVRPGRKMVIAARDSRGEFHSTTIFDGDRNLIDPTLDDPNDDFLFPEMQHGDTVRIEGVITRGNQETNTFGFSYGGHILNCVPEAGNVRRFKHAMFLTCRIEATVLRHVGSQFLLDKKPTLLVSDVHVLDHDFQQGLF